MAEVTNVRAIQIAWQLERAIGEELLKAVEDLAINGEAYALYRWIAHEASDIFEDVLVNSFFGRQLRSIGLDSAEAVASGYLQLLCDLFWDYSIACRSDPAIAEHIGVEFGDLAAEFGRITGLGEMLDDTLELSEHRFQSDGQGVDFRPVMDAQMFDFLQTLTDGRYTDSHLRDLGLAEMFAVAGAVYTRRLDGVMRLKKAWGLNKPVL